MRSPSGPMDQSTGGLAPEQSDGFHVRCMPARCGLDSKRSGWFRELDGVKRLPFGGEGEVFIFLSRSPSSSECRRWRRR